MALPTTGYGAGPFGLHPFGVPLVAFDDETPTVLRSSRDVNLISGGYNTDSDGNFEGMDDVGQRVILAVRQAVVPDLQGVGFDETMRAEILRVLGEAGLTAASNPDITVNAVVVSPFPGGVRNRVDFTNNLTGTRTSLTIEP